MLIIPSLDLQAGRSRLVFWPGAATGVGAPTDRPDRIARHFAELGAPALHLVDLDGATQGRPANTDAIQAVSRAVGVPLQVAGGMDGPTQIELAFAAGATRVVVPLWVVVEDPEMLAACLAAGGDWMAVGLDARQERLQEYPWRTGVAPTFEGLIRSLADAGVRRFIISHGGAAPQLDQLRPIVASIDADLLLAGGVTEMAMLPRLRDAGIHGVILGEALFTGAIDFASALRLAA